MARPPRIEIAGGYYHMTSRGNDGQPTYFDDRDREDFFGMLDRIVMREGWLVLAYCLMTNHYHLVIKLDEDGLSSGMQTLNGWYARTINRRYGRTGHLFRNRFAAVLLETEAHVLEAIRYVVLNPVRAGMCDRPERWRWSSYRASAGLARVPRLLAQGELLSLFGPDPVRAQERYQEFVMAGISGPTVSDTVTKFPQAAAAVR